MSVDFEAVRAGLEQAIPFNKYLGLEVVAVADGSGSLRLPDDPNLLNHVGSQHAGALFSVAEAASGAAFIGAFLERMGEITPLAKSASIDYRNTLARLAPLVEQAEAVVSGHGAPQTSVAALRQIDADLAYLDALERGAERPSLPEGRDSKRQHEIHAENLAQTA